MLFRIDFGPITVSKLHMWYRNFTCCFETTYQISEITHCHVGKTVYFLFHSLECYFENRLCRSDFASCCFETTPCGFENTPLVETISYHILPIISIPWHVKSKLSPVVSTLCHVVSKRHRVASTFHYVISKMMCSYTCHLEKLWCFSNKIHTYS